MFNVCENCGAYHADKEIDPAGPAAICPECGHAHPFASLPLLVVGGASGAGKSTICSRLAGKIPGAVLLEADIFWRPEFNTPEDGYRVFFDLWLRLAKNIAQSAWPVVLFGAGFGVPGNLEGSVERRYFSEIHYLALVCDDAVLAERLRRRPAWRETGQQEFIERQQGFNRWFKNYEPEKDQPPIAQIETTHRSLETTVSEVSDWIRRHLIRYRTENSGEGRRI